MDDDQRNDEITALLAIYANATIEGDTLSISLTPTVGLTLTRPPEYPHAPVLASLEGVPRSTSGPLLAQLAAISTSAAAAGEPCMFNLVEVVRDAVGDTEVEPPPPPPPVAARPPAAAPPAYTRPLSSATVTVAKSVFVAHVGEVHNSGDVANLLTLLLSDPHIARASHPTIYAWRAGAAGDNDDDGEDRAGGRLAELLQLLACDNLAVVVTRWFGGTLLGPTRFKVICDVARMAIEAHPNYRGRG